MNKEQLKNFTATIPHPVAFIIVALAIVGVAGHAIGYKKGQVDYAKGEIYYEPEGGRWERRRRGR